MYLKSTRILDRVGIFSDVFNVKKFEIPVGIKYFQFCIADEIYIIPRYFSGCCTNSLGLALYVYIYSRWSNHVSSQL